MNRLADETSPYLLQHAENPVEWYPWGDEALERARAEDRPILLSIGYSACHWCHVMAHESFEDAETAELMNRLFVNIKVDREERPDLDAVYMNAVVGMTGHGGWPMTMFLTPAGEPFHGGTYYPPEPRHGMPSFRQVLAAVDDAWRERRGEVMQAGAALAEGLRRSAEVAPSTEPLTGELLTGAMPALRSAFDPDWGGFGGAPKFPAASTVGLLLRLHVRTGSVDALRMATDTLDGMALGGMHDLIGGGFHRYAVDRIWLVPHFEKMLYDNALLATAYLEGFAVTGERRYATDRRGHARLPRARDAAAGGRLRLVPGRRHRRRGGLDLRLDAGPARRGAGRGAGEPPPPRTTASPRPGTSRAERPCCGRRASRPPDLAEIRAALLERRARRPQPGRDDKALASWNGLALAALAQGGWRLRRPDLLDAARDCARFLLGPMTGADGRLRRTYRLGSARIPAYLDDYAAVCHGLLELALATGEPEWLPPARRLADEAVARFGDEQNGGFYQSASDAEALVARHKELDDNPTPSGNALLAQSPDPARPHLRRARARAARRRHDAAGGRRDAARSPRPRPDALDARPPPLAAAGGGGGRGRRPTPRRGRSPTRCATGSTPTWCTRSATGPMRAASRCSRAAGRWTARPPPTSASGSPAGRR